MGSHAQSTAMQMLRGMGSRGWSAVRAWGLEGGQRLLRTYVVKVLEGFYRMLVELHTWRPYA